MGMMMMTATALRKSRGLIQLMGQYEIRFANDDDGDVGNGDDDVDDDDNGHGSEEESRSDTADGRWSLDANGKWRWSMELMDDVTV